MDHEPRSTVPAALFLLILLTAGCHLPEGAQTNRPPTREQFQNGLGMTFVRIDPAIYMMGAQPGEPARADETPHRVSITRPFFIAQREVTVGQFRTFVEDVSRRQGTPWLTDAESGVWANLDKSVPVSECDFGETKFRPERGVRRGGLRMTSDTSNRWVEDVSWTNPGFPQTGDHPVVFVSWNDAVAFTEWLSAREGRRYRLPTEAEWELAARGGTQTAYWWGDAPATSGDLLNAGDLSFIQRDVRISRIMQMNDRHVYTAPVGSYRANPFGLYDMLGNVWEWVGDRYAPFGSEPVVDPVGPPVGELRIARGGAFGNTPDRLRAAARFCDPPFSRHTGLGFRVVLEP